MTAASVANFKAHTNILVPVLRHKLAQFPYYNHQDESAQNLFRESDFSLHHSRILAFKLAFSIHYKIQNGN